MRLAAATTASALALRPDLAVLLESLQADAPLVQRHLWLIALLEWIRGGNSTGEAVARVDIFLDVLEARPDTTARLQLWWRNLLEAIDGTTLLSDYGFASRNAFVSELVERLHRKLLPASPETVDACELFALVMPSPLDAQWLAALPDTTLARLARLLSAPTEGQNAWSKPGLTYWQNSLLEAITACTSQIRAAGFTPEMRLRMSASARDASPFHALAASFDALRDAWLASLGRVGTTQNDTAADDNVKDDAVELAAQNFRTQLDACRQAAASVYAHLDAHGISVDLVFRLRQLRQRVLRIRALLDCLLGDPPYNYSARLLSHLASVGQEQRSIGALVTASSSLLAAKTAERSSETGEHYITRTRAEYTSMLVAAAGGGALTAGTTAMKFAVMALGLSAFWMGFWSGLVYAASFVFIQLLHFTLATKQPSMTAPAMAAKLKDTAQPGAIEAFVDEVTHLVRSQVAAVLGNVAVVFPVVVLMSVTVQLLQGQPMISADRAHYVLHSLNVWGPSLLFAAFTGVLLFASSIIAGWVENWFVLHRLDSAIRYNPRISRVLGAQRADVWAHFMRHHISGFAANISLGFMLGLVPPVLAFVGLGLDVRHVTLSAGQLGAACASLGWSVVHSPALWWAVASIPLIGVLNLGVSFYLAFRVALQAHNVSATDRGAIYKAIARRVRHAPLSFFWPAREGAA
jgi:site-specific recombinase